MDEPGRSTRDGLHTVTRGTLLMLVGTLVYVAATFLIRVELVRTLTIGDWNAFAYAVALAGLLASIGTLGLPQAIARSLPFAPGDNERRTIVRSASRVLVGSAACFTAGMAVAGFLVGAFYQDPALAETLEAFSVAVGCAIVGSLVISIFQGFEDVRPNVFYSLILNPTLFLALIVVLFRTAPRPLLFPETLAAYVVANALMIAGLVVYARYRLPKRLPAGPAAPGEARRLYLFAIPLFVVSVASFVTGNADLLLLGVFHYSGVGAYSATLTLARLLQIGTGSLAYIFLPVAARFVREKDIEGVRMTYATATKWVVLTSLPLFFLFFFFPSASLGFVYGGRYTGTTVPLQILVTGSLLATLVGPAAAAQVSFGQTRLLVYNAVLSALVDVALAGALIPTYGATGAAIAWATANALNPILSIAEIAFLEGVHPFRPHYVVPVLLTAVPVSLVFLFVPLSVAGLLLPVVGLGIAAAFIAIVILTGSVDHGDGLALEVIERTLGRRLTWLRRIGGWRARRGSEPLR